MQTVYIYHANGNGKVLTLYDVETPEEVLNTLEEVLGVEIEEDSAIWCDHAFSIGGVMFGPFAKHRIGDYLVTVKDFG